MLLLMRGKSEIYSRWKKKKVKVNLIYFYKIISGKELHISGSLPDFPLNQTFFLYQLDPLKRYVVNPNRVS